MRAVLVVRELGQRNLAPEIGGKESVGFCDLDTNENLKNRRGAVQLLTAAKVAFKKLPIVAVEPLDWV